jgi:hypothetical protein
LRGGAFQIHAANVTKPKGKTSRAPVSPWIAGGFEHFGLRLVFGRRAEKMRTASSSRKSVLFRRVAQARHIQRHGVPDELIGFFPDLHLILDFHARI